MDNVIKCLISATTSLPKSRIKLSWRLLSCYVAMAAVCVDGVMEFVPFHDVPQV